MPNLIDLSDADLDQRVYRIYQLDRFTTMLAAQRDAVVNPKKWDDPFENFFLQRTAVIDSVSGTAIPLENLASDWYGQCWSLNEDTDAMWRIYSPNPKNSPGVKVGSTIRRIFDNLKSVGSSTPDLQFFMGRVNYRTEHEIVTLMGHLTFTDIAIGGQGDQFAELLCMKREAFRHENEVRLLFQDIPSSKRGSGGVFTYPLSPNVIFDDVVLDPRLDAASVTCMTTTLTAAGCGLPISQSSLYAAPTFVIPF